MLAAWYLCVPGYTQLIFAVNLNSVQQDGWVGWVLGVCIIDRACTLCNHNRQVFPKIPRSAGERLLFWCLPAPGGSMDRTILCCSCVGLVGMHQVISVNMLFWYAQDIIRCAVNIQPYATKNLCGVKYSKHNVTLPSKVKIYIRVPIGRIMKWEVPLKI